jgi:16S rRNA (guanine1207-N2)-methyltransferase
LRLTDRGFSGERMKLLPNTDARVQERERKVAAALLDAWPLLTPALASNAAVLVADDLSGDVERHLGGAHTVTPWRRIARIGRAASDWPPDGPYAAATLRLPRSRDAMVLALHAIASMCQPGAPVLVYGANDEGIKGAKKRLEAVVGTTSVLEARSHCRVLMARLPEVPNPDLRPDLTDWAIRQSLALPSGEVELISYPGVFAKGRLDAATSLFLANLPDPPVGGHVLDFGCGIGVIGAELLRRVPDLQLQCLDADAMAARAARENLPGALVRCGASWSALPAYTRYDRIVSNPPIHRGKDRDYTVLKRLIEGAPARLLDQGELWLVVQRQVAVYDTLQQEFSFVDLVTETPRFSVWSARRPFK